ncbi:hypothetical protein ABVT39_024104 [Epinephelus coioides]
MGSSTREHHSQGGALSQMKSGQKERNIIKDRRSKKVEQKNLKKDQILRQMLQLLFRNNVVTIDNTKATKNQTSCSSDDTNSSPASNEEGKEGAEDLPAGDTCSDSVIGARRKLLGANSVPSPTLIMYNT